MCLLLELGLGYLFLIGCAHLHHRLCSASDQVAQGGAGGQHHRHKEQQTHDNFVIRRGEKPHEQRNRGRQQPSPSQVLSVVIETAKAGEEALARRLMGAVNLNGPYEQHKEQAGHQRPQAGVFTQFIQCNLYRHIEQHGSKQVKRPAHQPKTKVLHGAQPAVGLDKGHGRKQHAHHKDKDGPKLCPGLFLFFGQPLSRFLFTRQDKALL